MTKHLKKLRGRKEGEEGRRERGKSKWDKDAILVLYCLRETINNLDLVGIHGGVGDENSWILQSLWLVDSNRLLQQESCDNTNTFRNKTSGIL